jgi:hypothetical protein
MRWGKVLVGPYYSAIHWLFRRERSGHAQRTFNGLFRAWSVRLWLLGNLGLPNNRDWTTLCVSEAGGLQTRERASRYAALLLVVREQRLALVDRILIV